VLGAVDEVTAAADALGFEDDRALPVRRRMLPPVPPDATTRVDL
jgi:hypothetical protein